MPVISFVTLRSTEGCYNDLHFGGPISPLSHFPFLRHGGTVLEHNPPDCASSKSAAVPQFSAQMHSHFLFFISGQPDSGRGPSTVTHRIGISRKKRTRAPEPEMVAPAIKSVWRFSVLLARRGLGSFLAFSYTT